METIKFEGRIYPVAIVNMPFGEIKISTEALNEKLMTFDGNYVSENARFIDEDIFYFVSEENISLENDKIVNLILSDI